MTRILLLFMTWFITISNDLCAQQDTSRPWQIGMHLGNSFALYPDAEWPGLDRFTLIDGIIYYRLYDVLAQQIGYLYFPSEAIIGNVSSASTVAFTIQRGIGRQWSVGMHVRRFDHKHHAIQLLEPVDSVGFPFISELSTSVELYELGLSITRYFGSKKFRPFLSVGAGLTAWHQDKIIAEIAEISFPISRSKGHNVRPIIPSAGFTYRLSRRLQFRLSADATLLVEKSKAPKVVEHGTVLAGVVYAL